MTSFASLGITEPILTALTDYGYAEPTVIQEKAIPAGIAGRDVLGSAQTGTGKDLCFRRAHFAAAGPRGTGENDPGPDSHPHPGAGHSD